MPWGQPAGGSPLGNSLPWWRHGVSPQTPAEGRTPHLSVQVRVLPVPDGAGQKPRDVTHQRLIPKALRRHVLSSGNGGPISEGPLLPFPGLRAK